MGTEKPLYRTTRARPIHSFWFMCLSLAEDYLSLPRNKSLFIKDMSVADENKSVVIKRIKYCLCMTGGGKAFCLEGVINMFDCFTLLCWFTTNDDGSQKTLIPPMRFSDCYTKSPVALVSKVFERFVIQYSLTDQTCCRWWKRPLLDVVLLHQPLDFHCWTRTKYNIEEDSMQCGHLL